MRPYRLSEIPEGKREPELEKKRGKSYLDTEYEEKSNQHFNDASPHDEKVGLKAEKCLQIWVVLDNSESQTIVKYFCIYRGVEDGDAEGHPQYKEGVGRESLLPLVESTFPSVRQFCSMLRDMVRAHNKNNKQFTEITKIGKHVQALLRYYNGKKRDSYYGGESDIGAEDEAHTNNGIEHRSYGGPLSKHHRKR